MSEDYRSMWADLGLDLAAHDALLGVLGQAYQDIYLTQKNRPEGMGYFDFVMSEVHGLRIKELLDEKAAGRKIIGSYCVFVPEEIVLAANATFLPALLSGIHTGRESVGGKKYPLSAHRNRLQHGGCRSAEDTCRSLCGATQINRDNDTHV